MDKLRKKAKEGGYVDIGQNEHYTKGGESFDCDYKMLCDPNFFQALGKACGWKDGYRPYIVRGPLSGIDHHMTEKTHAWQFHALRFHEINLTEGWDKAVEYLSELVK